MAGTLLEITKAEAKAAAKAKAAKDKAKAAAEITKAAAEVAKAEARIANVAAAEAEAKAPPQAKRPKKVAQPVPLGVGTVNDHEERLVAIENKLGL